VEGNIYRIKAVAAAEQIEEDKKTYVLKFIRDKGVTITDQELDALIEAAVYEINRAKCLLFKDLDVSEEKIEVGQV